MMLQMYAEGERYDMLTVNFGEEDRSKATRHLKINEVWINLLIELTSDIEKRTEKYEH